MCLGERSACLICMWLIVVVNLIIQVQRGYHIHIVTPGRLLSLHLPLQLQYRQLLWNHFLWHIKDRLTVYKSLRKPYTIFMKLLIWIPLINSQNYVSSTLCKLRKSISTYLYFNCGRPECKLFWINFWGYIFLQSPPSFSCI